MMELGGCLKTSLKETTFSDVSTRCSRTKMKLGMKFHYLKMHYTVKIHTSREWGQRWSLACLPSASSSPSSNPVALSPSSQLRHWCEGVPAHPQDSLSSAPQPGRGNGATQLLDSDVEANGRQARLHLWPHPWDACILTVQCTLLVQFSYLPCSPEDN